LIELQSGACARAPTAMIVSSRRRRAAVRRMYQA
jgi:hypothetical protein